MTCTFGELLYVTQQSVWQAVWSSTPNLRGRKDFCGVIEILEDKVLDLIAEHLAVLDPKRILACNYLEA